MTDGPDTYTVYILKTSGNTLYVGQTSDLQRRLGQHASKTGKGAKYLRMFPSFELVYTETVGSKSEALRREAQLKSWNRKRKDELIAARSAQ